MPGKSKTLPPPRVRREPPTIEEAVLAAEGLTSDPQAQLEIAAGLMGVSEEEVRPFIARPARPRASSVIAGNRTVVVERRVSRAAGLRPTLSARSTPAR
jgi:hypothetical protein